MHRLKIPSLLWIWGMVSHRFTCVYNIWLNRNCKLQTKQYFCGEKIDDLGYKDSCIMLKRTAPKTSFCKKAKINTWKKEKTTKLYQPVCIIMCGDREKHLKHNYSWLHIYHLSYVRLCSFLYMTLRRKFKKQTLSHVDLTCAIFHLKFH